MGNQQQRQGDVFLERIQESDIPAHLVAVPREQGRVILAHGEVTGHTHAVAESAVGLFARPGETTGDVAERWLRVGAGGAVVRHEEHAALTLAPGLYRVVHQREWGDEQEPILVAD